MHQELLRSLFPWLVALAVLFAFAQGIVRFSGARMQFGRLRELHRCEAGGVQSLAFVLALPMFLAIVMFIVQIALVMVGLITVNMAAFAAARSAAVWIPAYVSEFEAENRLPAGISQGSPQVVDFGVAQSSPKYQKIFEAAALACVPIAPSRAVRETDQSLLGRTRADEGLLTLYPMLVPSSASNSVMPQRLRNKLAYSLQNTRLTISFVDKNSGAGGASVPGPTYNPVDHPDSARVPYIPSEVGWQDPVTIEVQHQFRLLPGPGRFLAKLVTRYDGRTDDVAPMIQQQGSIHTVPLRGSATLTIEGLKSIRPYVQPQ